MKNLRTYYLIDRLSETILGSFTAPNDAFAVKRAQSTIEKNPDLLDLLDTIMLVSDIDCFSVCETYEECTSLDYTHSVSLDSVRDYFESKVDKSNG